jgi:hypothetical protein
MDMQHFGDDIVRKRLENEVILVRGILIKMYLFNVVQDGTH